MSAISVTWLDVSWGAVYFETNYGLMQHSFIEIKNKLLRALDAEYNVVDMATVFEVVAVLEKTPITPEILETTRLGKVINECRRRTSNETLAKRAKHLLRYWRNMMIPACADKPLNTSLVSPSSSTSIPQQNGTSIRSSATVKMDQITTTTPSISPIFSSTLSVNRTSNLYDCVKISPSSSLSPIGDPKVESVPKTHVANKRLRKNAASHVLGEPPAKVSKVNGSVYSRCVLADVSSDNFVDCDFSRLRELPTSNIADVMHHSSGKSCDPVTVPNADPPLPKRRSRKKKKRSEDDDIEEKLVALSKTVRVKTTEELVAELKSRSEDRLQSSSTSGISDRPNLSNNVSGYESGTTNRLQTNEKYVDPEAQVEREIITILSKLPPLNLEQISWEFTEEPISPLATHERITESELERYLQHDWDEVNGCVTHGVSDDGYSFRRWHEMVARRTTNDDLIHILPYSIVD